MALQGPETNQFMKVSGYIKNILKLLDHANLLCIESCENLLLLHDLGSAGFLFSFFKQTNEQWMD